GEFNVSGSNLRTSLSFNFEAASTKSIAIKVSDGGGCSYVKTFQISILDANDTPSEISLSNSTVEENQPVGTLVGNFSSIDEDVSNTHTYALVSGTGSAQNSYFNITNNQLVTSAILNHEQLNSYSIRVRTTDNGSAFFEKVFVISTIDVNDLPTNVLLSNNTIDENQSVSSFVGILSSTDEDIADVHSYSLVVGSGSTHNSYFAISGGNLVTDSVLNFESISTYNIRLRSTDLSGTFYEENFTINANDLNDTPTDITLSFKLIQEQQPVGTFIGKFSTTDEDANDTHVYTLASGTGDTHNAKFTIKDDSLKAAEVFYFIDFDTLKIRLRATDLAGAFVEKEFAIIVVDVNDQPTDMLLVGISVNENSSIKTYIGKLTTSDVDTWDSHTYSLVDGIGDENNDYFSVKNDSLLIDSVMNFELNNNLKLRIRTTDLFGLFIEKTFNITVNDLNEAPELIADTFFISEDAQLATIIGKVTFYEEDSNQDHIFTLVDNVTPFEIDSLSGNVSLFKSELDYENIDSVYTILVQVKDNGTPFLTDTLSYRIIVRDAIEGLLPCTHFISPNSDGKNDFWKIENVFLYENFEVLIFNDNGQLVFQKEKAYNNEFDGKFNGNNLPDGVYYYALNNKENGLKFKGIITIIN
ncbi:MAG: cadherin domain-containing protein, partial [Bacteroidetes bacterium]|nr:cadherin domain-containing protein [Bacteroidota bacterium]